MGFDPRVFGANIFLLIGLLLAAAVGFLLLITVWMLVKAWLWQIAERREKRRVHRESFRPDGEPYPPFDRGICDRCGRAIDKVYYLPSGERLCPEDYEKLYGPQA
jgi:hypothetical protein